MPTIVRKIKIGSHAVEFDRMVKSIRKELALRSLMYLNPSVARGILGQEIRDRTSLMLKKVLITKKMEKLGNSMLGRSYINNVVINAIKKYGKEQGKIELEMQGLGRVEIDTASNHRLKLVREELKNLYRNTNIKGVDYIQKVREIIYRHFDEKTARKIDKELMIRINMLEISSKGIVDLIDGRTFYRSDNKPINFANTSVEKGIEFAGVKKTKRDYYELKVAKLMVQALQSSKSPEESVTKFLELYNREKASDPVFRDAEFKSALSFLVGMYNMSAITSIVEKTVVLLPRRLLAMVSRLLASAYRMIPIVGGIASANVQAAEAISEIGENLSARVESSAHMPVDLRMIMADRYSIISDILQKQMLEEMRRQQSPA